MNAQLATAKTWTILTAIACSLMISGCIRLAGSKDSSNDAAVPIGEPVTESASTGGTYKVKFETTAGDFVMKVHRDWAPIGAEHFHELVSSGFYDECRFFRVVPGFMVQFGLNGDPKVQKKWREKTLRDDPVKQSNTRGFVSFATAGPNTRTTQIFINYASNTGLNQQGFSPFAEVIEGMENVDKIEAKHREQPDQGQIQGRGNEYLNSAFPDLDYVKKATIFDEVPAESNE